MNEYKAYEDFQQIVTPSQINIHSLLKSQMKLWHTKNINYLIAT